MICEKCGKELVMKKTKISYLGNDFEEELPRCPECGQVFISEETALGKMARVEEEFEEK